MSNENKSLTKKDFERCYALEQQIKKYKKLCDPFTQLGNAISNLGSFSFDIPVQNNSDDYTAIYKEKLKKLMKEYSELSGSLKNDVILNIDDPNQLAILKMRYEKHMSWSEIIHGTYLSERSVFRYHKDALAILDEKRYPNGSSLTV